LSDQVGERLGWGRAEGFRVRIENVTSVVANQVNSENVDLTRTNQGSTFLGVYRGVPLTHPPSLYNLTMPDITMFFDIIPSDGR
jgi:hypothetical protein